MKIWKPEILTHPNIPKPFHGMAPRTLMGEAWWNVVRREAYARYNYRCVACGVHKTQAQGPKWLEAHEYWNIDYIDAICEVKSIEPLCHFCHNFIHSGRLSMIVGGEKTVEEAVAILEHGFMILALNGLDCFPGTAVLARELKANTLGVKAYELPDHDPEWHEWKLLFNGLEYRSQFAGYEDWAVHYGVIRPNDEEEEDDEDDDFMIDRDDIEMYNGR